MSEQEQMQRMEAAVRKLLADKEMNPGVLVNALLVRIEDEMQRNPWATLNQCLIKCEELRFWLDRYVGDLQEASKPKIHVPIVQQ